MPDLEAIYTAAVRLINEANYRMTSDLPRCPECGSPPDPRS